MRPRDTEERNRNKAKRNKHTVRLKASVRAQDDTNLWEYPVRLVSHRWRAFNNKAKFILLKSLNDISLYKCNNESYQQERQNNAMRREAQQ